jgi:hypothetical protein
MCTRNTRTTRKNRSRRRRRRIFLTTKHTKYTKVGGEPERFFIFVYFVCFVVKRSVVWQVSLPADSSVLFCVFRGQNGLPGEARGGTPRLLFEAVRARGTTLQVGLTRQGGGSHLDMKKAHRVGCAFCGTWGATASRWNCVEVHSLVLVATVRRRRGAFRWGRRLLRRLVLRRFRLRGRCSGACRLRPT